MKNLIEKLNDFNRGYQKEDIELAIQSQEELTPLMINILDDVFVDPEKYIEQYENHYAYFYAVYLLAYFKEAKAHQIIIDIFSLPGEQIENLYGDVISDDLAMILLQTCAGDTKLIKQLITNEDAYEFCRSSAVQALVYSIQEDLTTKQEVIDFISTILKTAVADDEKYFFYSHLVVYLVELYAIDSMDLIKQSLNSDFVDEFVITLESAERTLAKGEAYLDSKLEKEYKERCINDLHQRLSSWYSLNPEQIEKDELKSTNRDGIYNSYDEPEQDPGVSSYIKIDKKKKKSKKKMQKKSKRKNRK